MHYQKSADRFFNSLPAIRSCSKVEINKLSETMTTPSLVGKELMNSNTNHWNQTQLYTLLHTSLVPRPSTPPVLLLAVCKNGGEGLGNRITWSVARLTSRILDHTSVFTFLSTVTEKLESGTSSRGEASPTCKIALSFAPQDNCITVGYFHTCHSAAFGAMAFSLGMFHMLSVALCWHMFHLGS